MKCSIMNDTLFNVAEHNKTQHNGSQYIIICNDAPSTDIHLNQSNIFTVFLSVIILNIVIQNATILSVIMLDVMLPNHYLLHFTRNRIWGNIIKTYFEIKSLLSGS